MSDYEKLLERGIKKVPKNISSGERFEIPVAKGFIEKKKTIVSNFKEIAEKFRREPKHLLKFLQREFATPGSVEGSRLILGRKISSVIINQKIQKYAKEFVICPGCSRPDTKMIRENRVLILKCQACGAKYPIKAKI